MSTPPFEEAKPLQQEYKHNTYRNAQEKADYHGGRLLQPGELSRQVCRKNQNHYKGKLNYQRQEIHIDLIILCLLLGLVAVLSESIIHRRRNLANDPQDAWLTQ